MPSNLTIHNQHVYEVSDLGVLVHNNCDVTLWKAPQPGRTGVADELVNGFDAARYPGNGPYFASERSVAEAFQNVYQNGLQEIRIPKHVFDDLVDRGVIRTDGYFPKGQSWHVPAESLDEFNAAIKLGSQNVYHP